MTNGTIIANGPTGNGNGALDYLGGTSTGTVTDSVYSGGTYTPGAEYVSLTVEGVVTTSGATGGMGPGGGPGGGGAPPGQ